MLCVHCTCGAGDCADGQSLIKPCLQMQALCIARRAPPNAGIICAVMPTGKMRHQGRRSAAALKARRRLRASPSCLRMRLAAARSPRKAIQGTPAAQTLRKRSCPLCLRHGGPPQTRLPRTPRAALRMTAYQRRPAATLMIPAAARSLRAASLLNLTQQCARRPHSRLIASSVIPAAVSPEIAQRALPSLHRVV